MTDHINITAYYISDCHKGQVIITPKQSIKYRCDICKQPCIPLTSKKPSDRDWEDLSI